MAKWAGERHVCIVTGRPGADVHHIYTRGARKDLQDKLWNQIPVAHAIHVEWHTLGTKKMATLYPNIFRWLVLWGWEQEPTRGKWIHPEAISERH